MGEPLKAAVEQIGAAYVEAMASLSPNQFLTRLKRFLQRDDLLADHAALWQSLNTWANQPLPGDALRRPRMVDPIRVVNGMRLDAPLDVLAAAFTTLRDAIQFEGLDRPVERPDSRQPTARDLQLVAWELVLGQEGLSMSASTP